MLRDQVRMAKAGWEADTGNSWMSTAHLRLQTYGTEGKPQYGVLYDFALNGKM